MSDRPNTTLIFGSPPAHYAERSGQAWGLWVVAALLAVMDVLLLVLVLIVGRG